ncbi:hypothetical protein ABZS81_27130 [Streptomyces sp. NPDC005318]|uniref:hypothetical protein n=1 Tax=Streptomyces sp. NPDC005318 TaxID=3157031 RepID=UPI0033BF4F7E
MSTTDLLGELQGRPPRDPYPAIWPWIKAQGPDTALQGLLAEAGRTDTPRRRLALELAAQLPVDSDEPWRQAAAHPVLARRILRDDDPAQQALSPQDLLWLAVDECAAAWLGNGPARLLERFHDLPGATGPERLTALNGSGHPDAAALDERATDRTPGLLSPGRPRRRHPPRPLGPEPVAHRIQRLLHFE